MTTLIATPKIRSFSQAADTRADVASVRVAPQGVLAHLGPVARKRRLGSEILIAQVIARVWVEFGVKIESDGPLSRFERGETTPRHLDAVIAAYAAETGDDPADYWAEALESFRVSPRMPDPPESLLRAGRSDRPKSPSRGRSRKSPANSRRKSS